MGGLDAALFDVFRRAVAVARAANDIRVALNRV